VIQGEDGRGKKLAQTCGLAGLQIGNVQCEGRGHIEQKSPQERKLRA